MIVASSSILIDDRSHGAEDADAEQAPQNHAADGPILANIEIIYLFLGRIWLADFPVRIYVHIYISK